MAPSRWVPSPPLSARPLTAPRSAMVKRLAVGLWVYRRRGLLLIPKTHKTLRSETQKPTTPSAGRRRPLGRSSGLCVAGCGFALNLGRFSGLCDDGRGVSLENSFASRAYASMGMASTLAAKPLHAARRARRPLAARPRHAARRAWRPAWRLGLFARLDERGAPLGGSASSCGPTGAAAP